MSNRQTALVAAAAYLLTLAACSCAFGAVPDPEAAPVESVSMAVQLWKSGTLPAALIVSLFVALKLASAKIGLLQKGHAALVVAASLGALAVVIEPASRGTTPTAPMILGALLAAVTIVVDGKPKAPTA